VLYYYPDKFIGKPDALSHWLNYRDRLHDNENVVLLKLEFLAAQVMKGMVFEDEEWDFLTDIQHGNQFGY